MIPAPRVRLTFCALALLTFGLAIETAQAQPERGYIMQTAPYPVYSAPETAVYNLKWGRAVAKFSGGVQAEFNDNVNVSQNNRIADLSIGPSIDVGFLFPTSRENIIQLEMGAGYRWYMRNGGVNDFTVAPRSRTDYRVFWEDVQLNFHDMFMVTSDPVSNPQISGKPGTLINFQRFVNTVGVLADWRPTRDWGFLAGYDYTLDRSLTSDYTTLDRDDHAFTLGTYHIVNPKLSVGVNANYTMSYFRDDFQNDGWNFTIGPWFTYKATRFLSFDGSCGWTTSGYERNGRVGDLSSFNGFTWTLGARHVINSKMSHNLRGGRSLGVGLGSNYTDMWQAQYGFDWKLARKLSLHTLFSYENFRASSINADSGWRGLAYASLGFPVHRRWYGAVSYSFALKDSLRQNADYVQNRLTIDLRHQF